MKRNTIKTIYYYMEKSKKWNTNIYVVNELGEETSILFTLSDKEPFTCDYGESKKEDFKGWITVNNVTIDYDILEKW